MDDSQARYNELRSTLGGITVGRRAHPLSAWFVLALRLVIGFAFFYSGVEKILGGFAAQGYLINVAGTNGNPLEGAISVDGPHDVVCRFRERRRPVG